MNRYKFTKDPHAHWLDDRPLLGTTTILNVISKELTAWASGMACAEFGGWKNPKRNDDGSYIDKRDKEKLGERMQQCNLSMFKAYQAILAGDAGDFMQRVNRAYKAHQVFKEKRATEGTDLHDLAEQWIKWKISGAPFVEVNNPNHFDKLQPFIQWCLKNVKRFLFSEIHCYSERLWVGGKTDFGYEDNDGNYVLADIKSRDKDYFSDHVQCGFYDLLLLENDGLDKDGNKLWEMHKDRKFHLGCFDKHAIFTLGEKFTEPVFSKSVDGNRKAAEFALGLYKLKKEFDGK